MSNFFTATTTDTLESASHDQSDAQQMDTNQPNLEHQQSDTVEPISKKIMTEHQESVTNEPTLDNQSNQQNESISAPQSSPRQSHTSTTTKEHRNLWNLPYKDPSVNLKVLILPSFPIFAQIVSNILILLSEHRIQES